METQAQAAVSQGWAGVGGKMASPHRATGDRPRGLTGWPPGTPFPHRVGLSIKPPTTEKLACPRARAVNVCERGCLRWKPHCFVI